MGLNMTVQLQFHTVMSAAMSLKGSGSVLLVDGSDSPSIHRMAQGSKPAMFPSATVPATNTHSLDA
jgi:hypothetical protein